MGHGGRKSGSNDDEEVMEVLQKSSARRKRKDESCSQAGYVPLMLDGFSTWVSTAIKGNSISNVICEYGCTIATTQDCNGYYYGSMPNQCGYCSAYNGGKKQNNNKEDSLQSSKANKDNNNNGNNYYQCNVAVP